jgi:hypothetical protein
LVPEQSSSKITIAPEGQPFEERANANELDPQSPFGLIRLGLLNERYDEPGRKGQARRLGGTNNPACPRICARPMACKRRVLPPEFGPVTRTVVACRSVGDVARYGFAAVDEEQRIEQRRERARLAGRGELMSVDANRKTTRDELVQKEVGGVGRRLPRGWRHRRFVERIGKEPARDTARKGEGHRHFGEIDIDALNRRRVKQIRNEGGGQAGHGNASVEEGTIAPTRSSRGRIGATVVNEWLDDEQCSLNAACNGPRAYVRASPPSSERRRQN